MVIALKKLTKLEKM